MIKNISNLVVKTIVKKSFYYTRYLYFIDADNKNMVDKYDRKILVKEK